jgi:hypothetical protein
MSKQKYPQSTVTTSPTGIKTVRKGREHYSQVKAHAKNDRKRHEAYARLDKYDRLTTAQKLAELPEGACERQRVRLTKQLAAESQAPTKAKTVKQVPLTSAQKGAKAVKRAQDAVAALPVTKK